MELRDEKNKNGNWKTSELMLRLGAVGMFVISGVLILIFILFLPDKKCRHELILLLKLFSYAV